MFFGPNCGLFRRPVHISNRDPSRLFETPAKNAGDWRDIRHPKERGRRLSSRPTRKKVTGMTLEKIHDSLWLVEGEIVSFYGFPYPTRSAVARLSSGDLWVWSPVRLGPDLQAELARLGPVRHLVSPNKIHHLYLQDWSAAYPQAQLWGPQSTIKKRADLTFREPLQDIPPPEWGDDIDQAWFRGSIVMDEIVFLHRPSRTAIVADLIEGFGDRFLCDHWSWWRRPLARLDGITAGEPGAPREWRLSFLDRGPARAARDKALGWRCERVLIAHGEWARLDGEAFLARSFDWLGP
jgi:hypothetical protein